MTFANSRMNRPKKKNSLSGKKAVKKTAKKKPAGKKSVAKKHGKDDPGQTHFDGMEPTSIPAIDKVIKQLGKARSELNLWKEQEAALLGTISIYMHKQNLDTYQGCGHCVTVIPGDEKTKVKAIKDK